MGKNNRPDGSLFEDDGTVYFKDDSVRLWASSDESEESEQPWLAKIVSYNEANREVELQWYYWYDDAETSYGELTRDKNSFGKNELLLSVSTDWNPIASVRYKTFVLTYPDYMKLPNFPNRTYYWRQKITQNRGVTKLLPDVLPMECLWFCRGGTDTRMIRNPDYRLSPS
eukprot:Platyproteum_vivax@DN7432_c0_g1_i1.p1